MSEEQVTNSAQSRPAPLGVPLRMSVAPVPPLSQAADTADGRARRRFDIRAFSFQTRRGLMAFLRWFGVFLLVLCIIEVIFWLWVWQLSPDEFQRFTACLDAGVVPSWWEQFVYHIACFMGSL